MQKFYRVKSGVCDICLTVYFYYPVLECSVLINLSRVCGFRATGTIGRRRQQEGGQGGGVSQRRVGRSLRTWLE